MILLFALLPIVGILCIQIVPLRRGPGARLTSLTGSGTSRDVYAGTPYANANPAVAYVGDEACLRCHLEISEAYRKHPMGRSFGPIQSAGGSPPDGSGQGMVFESNGLQFSIEHRDGRVFHKAARRDTDGATVAETESEVRYTLGSGTRGSNYVIERDGFLSVSPIAWFAQEGRWGISPGYGEGSQQTNFERAIYPECLYCHTNQVRPMPGPLNRYEAPVFRGHAIGCERCHGPGALHVRDASSGSSMVNPAELSPELRESVCQQCHLQGAFRTTRAGRQTFDYRPGLPLHRFWAVFQRANESREASEAVGHVEQLELSRCFQRSGGRLGCISCHDPHKLPEPSAKVAYYRNRCLECHQNQGCSLPLSERESRGPADDCVACHMPRLKITNIPHTAATDHRIPRGAPGPGAGRSPGVTSKDGQSFLIDFFAGQKTEEEREASRRDLGVALSWVAGRLGPNSGLARSGATQAVPLLEEALDDRPDDRAAGNSLGSALEILGRGRDALGAYEAVLHFFPDDEMALRSVGSLAATQGRFDLANESLRRTIAVNPWRSDYHLALAKIHSQAGDWVGAVAACREALKLDPNQLEVRSMLIQGYLRTGDAARADAEFRALLRLFPASREVWQQWYESQKHEAGPRNTPR